MLLLVAHGRIVKYLKKLLKATKKKNLRVLGFTIRPRPLKNLTLKRAVSHNFRTMKIEGVARETVVGKENVAGTEVGADGRENAGVMRGRTIISAEEIEVKTEEILRKKVGKTMENATGILIENVTGLPGEAMTPKADLAAETRELRSSRSMT